MQFSDDLAEMLQVADSIRYSRPASISSKDSPDLQDMIQQHSTYCLTSISAPIGELRARWRTVSALPKNPETRSSLFQILHHAMDFDRTLALWVRNIPETWKTTEILVDSLSEDLRQIGAYQDQIDLYQDLWIAHTRNFCCTTRIFVQNIVLHCIDLLSTEAEEQYQDDRFVVTQCIQQMADEICASIPFLLGSKTNFGVDMSGLVFPQAEGKQVSEDHVRLATGLGSWFALEPLSILLQQPTLPPEQKMWIGRKLKRISWMYAIRMPSPLGPITRASLVDPPDDI